MNFGQGIAQGNESAGRSLDHEQEFGCRFDLSLPAIHRFKLRNDVDTRGQLAFHERLREPSAFFERAARSKNKSFVRHIKLCIHGSFDWLFDKAIREYEGCDGDANQVWHFWMAGGNGR
jgi:hypothetical protein